MNRASLLGLGLVFLGGCNASHGAAAGGGSDAGDDATTPSSDASTPSDAAVSDAPVDRATPPVVTTRTALTANNTAASSAFTDEYTPAARFGGSATPVRNGDAPPGATVSSDLRVGVVSKLPVRSLLYPGATTSIFVETQGWFCTHGATPLPTGLGVDQCGSHIDNGYNANFTAHANRQVADMMSRGIDGTIMDWSGQSAGTGVVDQMTTSTPAINTGAMFLLKAAAEASGGKFHVAVMEDEGINTCAATTGCDIATQITSDIAFLDTNFFGSSGYLTVGGRPVLFFFSVDATAKSYGKTIDWAAVRANAAHDPIFIFENKGGFGHAEGGGAYAWVHVTDIGAYPGSDPFGTASFLPGFYGAALADDAGMAWGSAYKGFDDNLVNGWGSGRRYVGQQCGKTWLDTLGLPAKSYSTQRQLNGMELITWDDYEEGTELETGIDNHVAVTANIQGARLGFSLALDETAPTECATAVDAGFDVTTTLDHLEVYSSPASDGEQLTLVDDGVSSSAASLDLTGKLTAGDYVLSVYAVGKPSIHNHLSAGVPYTAP